MAHKLRLQDFKTTLQPFLQKHPQNNSIRTIYSNNK